MAQVNGHGNSVHPTKDKTVDLINGDIAVELAVAGGPSDEEGEYLLWTVAAFNGRQLTRRQQNPLRRSLRTSCSASPTPPSSSPEAPVVWAWQRLSLCSNLTLPTSSVPTSSPARPRKSGRSLSRRPRSTAQRSNTGNSTLRMKMLLMRLSRACTTTARSPSPPSSELQVSSRGSRRSSIRPRTLGGSWRSTLPVSSSRRSRNLPCLQCAAERARYLPIRTGRRSADAKARNQGLHLPYGVHVGIYRQQG